MYQQHSETSREAYEETDHTGQRKDVLNIVKDGMWMGATADYIAMRLDIPQGTVAARFVELIGNGDIIKTNQRAKTRSGKSAYIHVAKEHWTEPMGKSATKVSNSEIETVAKRLIKTAEMTDDKICNSPAFVELKNLLGV